ncbi:hypothetical protein ZWY2020_044282 [Hordeum vulgare]|nr:hypothetical protein ZWY2020_044282 [Hordeum vulgare]
MRLSPPAMEFTSAEGKRLFAEALRGGTMEGFFNLISYFQTQSEPAFCGLVSLLVVLNALAIDPGRPWKRPGGGSTSPCLTAASPSTRSRPRASPSARWSASPTEPAPGSGPFAPTRPPSTTSVPTSRAAPPPRTAI